MMKKGILLKFLCLVVVTLALTMQAACSGSAEITFTLNVEFPDGTTRTETVTTSETNFGYALEDNEIIESNDGMVLNVFGVSLDSYATESSMMYWSFYIDGEYATMGVFDTTIKDGATYTFKAETYSW